MKDPIALFRLPQDETALGARLAARLEFLDIDLVRHVLNVFDDVKRNGDEAVRRVAEQFDKVAIKDFAIAPAAADAAVDALAPDVREAIRLAHAHVREVNELMLPEPSWRKEVRAGTVIGEQVSPLEAVSFWIPSKKGPLVSTAIMLVTAAQVAGVKRIVVATPPRPDGTVEPTTLAAARLAGANEFLIGTGVGTAAALTFGTESMQRVDGMFGPGPAAVAVAMGIAGLYGVRTALGIGPTDCAVIADADADPDLTALDLMNEAEHGPDSASLLVTTSQPFADRVADCLRARIAQTDALRAGFLRTVFGTSGRGGLCVVPDWPAAVALVNQFAPEHLLVNAAQPVVDLVLAGVRAAGEILLGASTPFAAANYAIGITAVLPTNGYARAFSGVTSRDMIRSAAVGNLTPAALQHLAPAIRTLAQVENLPGHWTAVAERLQ